MKYLEIVNMSPWLEAMDKCLPFLDIEIYTTLFFLSYPLKNMLWVKYCLNI